MNTRICPHRHQCPTRQGIAEEFLNRREWIKRFAIGSATVLGTGGMRVPLLAEISPGVQAPNLIKLNLSQHAALQTDFGSMRFNLFGDQVPNGIIIVTRAPGNVFYAVSGTCTHQGNIVDPYEPDSQVMICYHHNSVFDIQGRVITPAESPSQPNLPTYNTRLEGQTLLIEIPNLNFKVNQVRQAGDFGSGPRFQINFNVRLGARYRVLYTPDPAVAPTPVNFSNTAGGSMNQAQTAPHTNAAVSTRNVWVQNSNDRGFYLVEMMVTPY